LSLYDYHQHLLSICYRPLQRALIHPNIVQFISTFTTGQSTFIVIEHCPGGCLLDLLNTRLQLRLTPPEINNILHQTSLALSYIHSLGLIHRDIKIENVLVTASANGPLYKLCDFGSVTDFVVEYGQPIDPRQIQSIAREINEKTTPAYRAPELINLSLNFGLSQKIDIWVNN